MSSNLIKIVAGVFVLLAVILGFVAWKMGHDYADNSNRTATAAQQVQGVQAAVAPQYDVVIASKMIHANQVIDKDSVKVIKLEVTPSAGFYTKIDDVLNEMPLIDVDSGTPLTPQLIKGNPVAKQLPPGTKAVSLTLNDVIGVGGFVRPGDIVDVLVFLRNDQGNKIDPAQARILQKDALVLAYDDHVLMPAPVDKNNPNGQQQQQQQRRERTVVVAVPDSEVTRVMLGASLGEVRLALHGQSQDQATAAQAASAQQPAAAASSAPAAAPPAAPTPVSGVSLAPTQTAAAPAQPAAATPANAEQQLPDLPYTSEELAKLKPKRAVAKGAPQGIVIYRGSKASTVYP